jgi:hypothetical protein
MRRAFRILPFLLITACSTVQDRGVLVLYCTDLFHPHDDPDDHFDLAALYALHELDVRGIVLDQGDRQDERPGRIPVAQLNHLTGREVPCAEGLSAKLKNPDDRALDQPHQAGVRLILEVLEAADGKVTVITVGSLRDVAAAFNREPDLFRNKVSRLMIFIGEASAPTLEWNVGLDPHAFIRVMNSGLPVWWIPCFDGGNFKNKGNASYWKASHDDLLGSASDRVMNFFIYALLEPDADPLEYLDGPVDPEARERVLKGKRNLWCTAVFTEAAGRGIAGGKPFRFVPVSLFVDPEARVIYEESPRSHELMRFQIKNRETYAEVMTSVTRRLIGEL